MTTYTLRDCDSGVEQEIQAEDLADARRQAREWAADGSYDLDEGTIWVDVGILSEGESIETVTAQLDPPEPKCPGHEEHAWQSPHAIVGGIKENPGVWGHGGGVIMHACCMHCGARRVTDTWAQRRDTGEQGLESVRYDGPGHYELPEAEAAWRRR